MLQGLLSLPWYCFYFPFNLLCAFFVAHFVGKEQRIGYGGSFIVTLLLSPIPGLYISFWYGITKEEIDNALKDEDEHPYP